MVARLRPHWPALALACALTLAWTWRGWPELSVLRLPDTDDAMRLQQIRDWIAGQAFGDLHQYRLGGGLLMHWSRIGDFVPASVILVLKPWLGQSTAELVAVIVWPLAQFAAMLTLTAGIARRLMPAAAGPALLLATLAYPTTTLFMPGRIDHHALQVVLVLVQVRALIATAAPGPGIAAGIAVAIGAAIGLETLPLACVTGLVIAVAWWRGQRGAAARQLGFGIALAIALIVLLPIAGHGGRCDTIRPLALPAVAGAIALALLALTRPRWPGPFAAAAVTVLCALVTAHDCFAGPYAGVDPLVARLWLAHVEEAQSLAAAPAAHAIAYAGLLLAGTVACTWLVWHRAGAGWPSLLAFQLAGLALTLVQLRGAYVGAALAVVPVAALIARARGTGRIATVLGLWLAGAGLVYPLIAAAVAPHAPGAGAPDDAGCTSPTMLRRLSALPPGTLMAPIDLGAHAIAETRHAAVAGPYHRNDAGNAAMYRFFLGAPGHAATIARRWHVDYVALCPGDFAETGLVAPNSIAGGARPPWLVPTGNPNIWRVSRGPTRTVIGN